MATKTTNKLQIFIGVVVLLLAAASIAQTAYFQGKLDTQKDCLVDFVQAQNDALLARQQTSQAESDLTKNAMLAFSEAAEQPEADNQKALIAALLKYKADINEIAEKKKANPVPKFEEGACE